jgi:hypothetical protein
MTRPTRDHWVERARQCREFAASQPNEAVAIRMRSFAERYEALADASTLPEHDASHTDDDDERPRRYLAATRQAWLPWSVELLTNFPALRVTSLDAAGTPASF